MDSKSKKDPFGDAPKEIYRLAFFLHHFYKESDRGAALMGASMLEEVLKEVILNFLADRKNSNELVEGFNAPLATFSSRIMAAYALGLIEDIEFKEIEIIRKIRNLFGHSWNEIDFKTKEIDLQIKKLSFQEKNNRLTFNHTIANLLGELLWRAYYAGKERRISKKWPNKSGFFKRSE